MKVLITYKVPDIAERLCRAKGITTFVNKSKLPLSKNRLIKEGKNADALITLLYDKIDKEIIDFLPKWKTLCCCRISAVRVKIHGIKWHG